MEANRMKTASLLAAAVVTLVNIPLMAQQADGAAKQSAAVSYADVKVNQSASSFAAKPMAMRPVYVELQGKLDSKSAKAGDAVVVKTEAPMKTADGTDVPKGTRLVGHIAAVQAHDKATANSEIAVDFDRAEFKGGQTMAIHSRIDALLPPATAGVIDSMHSGDDLGGGVMGGGTHTTTGSGVVRTGPGIAGANGGGTTIENGQFVGDGRATERGGTEVDSTLQTQDNTARMTAVHGVRLAHDSSGKVSAKFSATGQNVHLDGGTQMLFQVGVVR